MEERIPRRSQPDCGRHEMHRNIVEYCATRHAVDASSGEKKNKNVSVVSVEAEGAGQRRIGRAREGGVRRE